MRLRTQVATDAGAADVPNEDLAVVTPNFLVVLDGATVRTETGCVHGVAWYADRLAAAIVDNARPALRMRWLRPSGRQPTSTGTPAI